jgi:hypothetical protein
VSDWELRKELEKIERLLWLLVAKVEALEVRVSRLEREVFHKKYPKTTSIRVRGA